MKYVSEGECVVLVRFVMVSPVCLRSAPLGRVSEVLTHGTAGAGEGGDELTEGLERSLTHL